MAWLKIDDQFSDHPKVMEAGPLASWLYVCGLCYAGRYTTDGHIPQAQLRKLADLDNAAELAEILVSVGLWDKADKGYVIHDFLDFNPSAEKVKADRAANAKRQSEWRERHRTGNGRYATDDQSVSPPERNVISDTIADEEVTTAPSPSPSPSPSPTPVPVIVMKKAIAPSTKAEAQMSLQESNLETGPPIAPPVVKVKKKRKRSAGQLAHDAYMRGVASLCQLDISQRGMRVRISKVAADLHKGNYSLAEVKRLYSRGGWWYTSYWIGKKGQPPRPEQIAETILQARNGNGSRGGDGMANLSPEREAEYDRIAEMHFANMEGGSA